MSSKEVWNWTKYPQDQFPIYLRKAPVHNNRLALLQDRRCFYLGTVGSLTESPYTQETFFRIARGEICGGRIFVERITKGNNGSDMKVTSDYTQFSLLPDEIKKKITVTCLGSFKRKRHRSFEVVQ